LYATGRSGASVTFFSKLTWKLTREPAHPLREPTETSPEVGVAAEFEQAAQAGDDTATTPPSSPPPSARAATIVFLFMC
jgi:hypothetical protein